MILLPRLQKMKSHGLIRHPPEREIGHADGEFTGNRHRGPEQVSPGHGEVLAEQDYMGMQEWSPVLEGEISLKTEEFEDPRFFPADILPARKVVEPDLTVADRADPLDLAAPPAPFPGKPPETLADFLAPVQTDKTPVRGFKHLHGPS